MTPTLGPDATGVGWVYQYAVVAKNRSLAELRSLQDWTFRYALAKAEGVAEVASVGGFVKQYNVVVDPQRLRALGIPLVQDARRRSRQQHGRRRAHGRALRVRVHGARPRLPAQLADIEKSCSRTTAARRCWCGTSHVSNSGPTSGAASPSSTAKARSRAASSLQRFGANALDVIDNVKERLAEIAPSLPSGVEIVPVYDRSELIHARYRDTEDDALRGERRRGAGVHRLPAARPQRAGRHHHAAGRRADGLRGHEGCSASARTS